MELLYCKIFTNFELYYLILKKILKKLNFFFILTNLLKISNFVLNSSSLILISPNYSIVTIYWKIQIVIVFSFSRNFITSLYLAWYNKIFLTKFIFIFPSSFLFPFINLTFVDCTNQLVDKWIILLLLCIVFVVDHSIRKSLEQPRFSPRAETTRREQRRLLVQKRPSGSKKSRTTR